METAGVTGTRAGRCSAWRLGAGLAVLLLALAAGALPRSAQSASSASSTLYTYKDLEASSGLTGSTDAVDVNNACAVLGQRFADQVLQQAYYWQPPYTTAINLGNLAGPGETAEQMYPRS